MTGNYENKLNILSYTLSELSGIVESLGEKSFRANQIFGWLAKGVQSFQEMTDLPSRLIALLDEKFFIGLPEAIKEQKSKDGTIKFLYKFHDGVRVEAVFMKYGYGNSLCISSQAGCKMKCSFCASTIGGLERNLTAGEMLAQVLKTVNITGEDIGHIVVMGMGEPFDNYEELSKFLKLIHHDKGYGISYRNITVSTCGIIPAINRFAEDFPQVNLAISLHASNDEVRKRLMPIASIYKYDDLMHASKVYTQKTGRRITFEYSLIKGVNDSAEDAERLAKQLKGWLAHVNLIPLNKVKERKYETTGNKVITTFKGILEKRGVPVTIRRTLGNDIQAACGQLRRIH